MATIHVQRIMQPQHSVAIEPKPEQTIGEIATEAAATLWPDSLSPGWTLATSDLRKIDPAGSATELDSDAVYSVMTHTT